MKIQAGSGLGACRLPEAVIRDVRPNPRPAVELKAPDRRAQVGRGGVDRRKGVAVQARGCHAVAVDRRQRRLLGAEVRGLEPGRFPGVLAVVGAVDGEPWPGGRGALQLAGAEGGGAVPVGSVGGVGIERDVVGGVAPQDEGIAAEGPGGALLVAEHLKQPRLLKRPLIAGIAAGVGHPAGPIAVAATVVDDRGAAVVGKRGIDRGESPPVDRVGSERGRRRGARSCGGGGIDQLDPAVRNDGPAAILVCSPVLSGGGHHRHRCGRRHRHGGHPPSDSRLFPHHHSRLRWKLRTAGWNRS